MQEETNEKTIALYIKTGKLTAQTLQKAMKAILSKGKKQLSKPPQGKQSLKQLMKQNAGVSNIEITEGNIKAFESTAKKYGIDFALKKDATESSPRYLVFFKGRDADVLTAAFKEFSAKKLTQEKKPSIRKLLSTLKEAAQGRNAERAKVKNKMCIRDRHCGECLDVFVRGKWKPTRIEYGDNWYLVGIRAEDLNGLRVRI